MTVKQNDPPPIARAIV